MAYAAYLALASVSAARQALRESAEGGGAAPVPGWASLLVRLPVVIAAYHIGYGLGTWRGLWDLARGRRASAASVKITR